MVAKAGGDTATPTFVIGEAVLVGLDEAWVKQQWNS